MQKHIFKRLAKTVFDIDLILIIISIVYNENWKYYTILVHLEISVPFCKIVPNTCTISKVNYIVLDIKPCLYSFSMSYIDSFLAGIRTKIFLHHIRTEKDVYSKQSFEQQKITEIYVYPMYFFIVKEFIYIHSCINHSTFIGM